MLFLFFILICNFLFSFEMKILEEKYLENCKSLDEFVVLDNSGFILADNSCHCINFYDKDLKWIKKFGRLSKKEDGFEDFWAVSSDDKFIYVSGHKDGVSIFNLEGNFIDFINTGSSTIRKIIPLEDYLIFGSSKSPKVKVIKDRKIIKEFGNLTEEEKFYPTGGFVPIAAEKGKIYFSSVLNYPILVYDFEGNLVGKIGDSSLIRKPYWSIKEEERKNFRNISAIIDIFIFKNFLISIQIMPKGSKNQYSWDIFNKDTGDMIFKGFETDFYILDKKDGYLVLEKYNEPCKIFFAEIIMEKSNEKR